ncbi:MULTISPECIES: DUF6328 family protein [Kitasatospora]|uniref:DUF6328 family protein n=1 Tax=Kitasatospora TaxID=2063 RepID=UPI000C6FFB23|nr:DUF6328 family protein [Kitasatospora sp. GP30]MDH6143341.1 hypothetical protein [Kitasatospora sp. GP30]
MSTAPEPDPLPHESPAQRADRNLLELLQELRVIQTGVQIVFAFLLGLAFTSRFPQLTDFQVDLYIITLLLTAIAAAVLATPVAIHRALFHRGYKRQIVKVSSRLTVLGLVILSLALNGAVLLVTDVVLGHAAAAAITATTASVFAGLWFVLPWTLRPDRLGGQE